MKCRQHLERISPGLVAWLLDGPRDHASSNPCCVVALFHIRPSTQPTCWRPRGLVHGYTICFPNPGMSFGFSPFAEPFEEFVTTPGVSPFPLRVLCSYLFVGDGPEFRDNVISSDAIPHLLTLVSSSIPVECLFDEVH